MKIKRFFANDIRQALRQVRESLGPDAVILSNKSVDGGIELIAARDYDEAVFSADEEARAQVSAASITPIDKRPQPKPQSDPRRGTVPMTRVEWSQDPVLVEMRREMKALRRMMENQLSELTWHEMGARRPLSQELLRRLMGLGLSPDICRQLVDRIEDAEDLEHAWRKALYFLASDLPSHPFTAELGAIDLQTNSGRF